MGALTETQGHASSPDVNIRPLQNRDLPHVVDIAHQNFDGPSFALFPADVRRGYKIANSTRALAHAISHPGARAVIAENPDGSVGGFMLTRRNGMRRTDGSYGEMDLRRLHVDPEQQGNGVGRALFDELDDQAQRLKVAKINSHSSGGSRRVFEKNGWNGVTRLNDFREVKTGSLVWVAEKVLAHPKGDVVETLEYVVYAGSNTTKLNKLRDAVNGTMVLSVDSEEDPVDDVILAAKSKAFSAAERVGRRGIQAPLIVATDIRSDLLVLNPDQDAKRYVLSGRGKPTSDDDILANFAALRDYSRRTGKPPVYVARAATYLHNPIIPNHDTVRVQDASIYLQPELVEELATPRGLAAYREEVHETYGADISTMSAGFALPVFLDRGQVAGVNGLAVDRITDVETVFDRAKQIVLNGLDVSAVQRRLGISS